MCIFLLGKFWPHQKLYGKNTLIVRCLSPVIFSRWIIRHFSLFCCVGWLFVLVGRSIVGYLVHRLFPFAKSEEKLIEIAVCFIDKQTHTHTQYTHSHNARFAQCSLTWQQTVVYGQILFIMQYTCINTH